MSENEKMKYTWLKEYKIEKQMKIKNMEHELVIKIISERWEYGT